MFSVKFKRIKICMLVLLMLAIVVGMAGCSKKALKAFSPDALGGGEASETGEPTGSVLSGASVPMTEALGDDVGAGDAGDAGDGSRGLAGEDGEIGEVEIEILGGVAGNEGELLALLQPGKVRVESASQRGFAGRAGQEVIVIEPRPDGDAGVSEERAQPTASGDAVRGSAGRAGQEFTAIEPRAVEQVPEPLIFAAVQPDSLLKRTNLQGPQAVSAATDSFFIKEDFEDIFFDFDQWAIPKPMQSRLSAHAQWLKAHPDINVLIEGHCDVRGSREYNVVLGEKRARSVRNFLVDLGVPKQRVSLLTYGKERLTCFENGEACHQYNRRARLLLK